MAFFTQQLLFVATDLTLALALSSLLYAVGCLGFAGLLGYAILLSSRILQNVKRNLKQKKKAVARNLRQKKEAFASMLWKSYFGQMAAKLITALAGFRADALCPSERAPTLEEDSASNPNGQQLSLGEKKCQVATETLSSSQLSLTGTSCEVTKQSGRRWEEERDKPKVPLKQKKIFRIPAFLLSLLFAPFSLLQKRRSFHRLRILLNTLEKSRN